MKCTFSIFILLSLSINHNILAFNPFEEVTEMDYMSSAYAVRHLAQLEQKLLPVLIDLQKTMENRLASLTSYIDEAMKEMENSETAFTKIRNISIFNLESYASETSSHLIKSFQVVKRLANMVPLVEGELTNLRPMKSFQESIVKLKSEIPFPTDKDVLQSMLSIVRLKQTYNLTAPEIMSGNLRGFQTNSGIPYEDLFQIGIVAMRTQVFPMCFEFLEKCFEIAKGTSSMKEIQRVESVLTLAIRRHDKALISGKLVEEENPFRFENPLNATDSEAFRTKVPIKIEPNFTNITDYGAMQVVFEHLCSGHDLRGPSLSKQYKCLLRNDDRLPGYFRLRPLKIEELNKDPLIVIIHDALSDNEINKLLKAAEPGLKRSKVAGNTTETQVNFARISSNTWFSDYLPDNQFNYISKRVQMITGLKVNYALATEDLQVANYGPGGLYAPHYDVARDIKEFSGESLGLYLERGDRIATFMFYLSDVERGGGTAFPAVGVAVQPTKGSAVFWYNLHNNGTTHFKTLHGGCPVLLGSKWISNKWIRSHEQMFIKKCLPEN